MATWLWTRLVNVTQKATFDIARKENPASVVERLATDLDDQSKAGRVDAILKKAIDDLGARLPPVANHPLSSQEATPEGIGRALTHACIHVFPAAGRKLSRDEVISLRDRLLEGRDLIRKDIASQAYVRDRDANRLDLFLAAEQMSAYPVERPPKGRQPSPAIARAVRALLDQHAEFTLYGTQGGHRVRAPSDVARRLLDFDLAFQDFERAQPRGEVVNAETIQADLDRFLTRMGIALDNRTARNQPLNSSHSNPMQVMSWGVNALRDAVDDLHRADPIGLSELERVATRALDARERIALALRRR